MYTTKKVKKNNLKFKSDIEKLKYREQLLELVKKNGLELKNALAFKNDKEIVMESILNNPESLQYASKDMRRCKEIACVAVSKDYKTLRFYINKNSNECVIKASLDNFISLRSPDVTEAFSISTYTEHNSDYNEHNADYYYSRPYDNYSDYIIYINSEKRLKRKLIYNFHPFEKRVDAWHPFEICNEKVINNKELVEIAISKWWPALKYASDNLREDNDIICICVKQSIKSLQYISNEKQLENKEFIKKILIKEIQYDPTLIMYVSNKLIASSFMSDDIEVKINILYYYIKEEEELSSTSDKFRFKLSYLFQDLFKDDLTKISLVIIIHLHKINILENILYPTLLCLNKTKENINEDIILYIFTFLGCDFKEIKNNIINKNHCSIYHSSMDEKYKKGIELIDYTRKLWKKYCNNK
jgi:hypothetical protein